MSPDHQCSLPFFVTAEVQHCGIDLVVSDKQVRRESRPTSKQLRALEINFAMGFVCLLILGGWGGDSLYFLGFIIFPTAKHEKTKMS
jgi:hypothetical protein